MARQLFDSEYIFGIHEPGGEKYMLEAGRAGWILFTEGIGSDPNDHSGKDYSRYSRQGLGIIARLNNGYHPNGTIPHSSRYEDFAQRCANFAAASQGCKIWIIGNEVNYVIERPPSLLARGVSASSSPADTQGEGAGDEAAESIDMTAEADDESQPERGGSALRRITRCVLRAISGGMGDAEIGGRESTVGTESDDTAGVSVTEDSTVAHDDAGPDPYHRSDPQRFSALHMDAQRSEGGEVDSSAPRRQRDLRSTALTETITPQRYADCYRLCREAIHAVPGHADDQVLVGPVAPWNNQTTYAGNANGDWVVYFRDVLDLVGADACDGIALHTYTHQADPNLIESDATMNPPFQDRHYEFRAYRDFMDAIPGDMRHLPLYITETDENVPWEDRNIGWVQRAYGEIDFWNRQPGSQQIRALILYRWPYIDRWYITGKDGVIADFRDALRYDYRWRPTVPPADFAPGDTLETTGSVNLRNSPGYQNKPADDVVATLPEGTRVVVLDGGPKMMDGLVWWPVETVGDEDETPLSGWMAQNSQTGALLLYKVDDAGEDGIQIGARVRTLTNVRMRNSPGYVGKLAADTIAILPPDREGLVLEGPVQADELTWWKVRALDDNRQRIEGWMAEIDPSGVLLLEKVDGMAPPSTPGTGQEDGTFARGDLVKTLDYVRVRRSPGYEGKDETDIVQDVAPGTLGKVLGGPRDEDELTWWLLKLDVDGGKIDGWAAEIAPNGVQLLGPAEDVEEPPSAGGTFRVGELVQAATYARVRRSPGFSNKPDTDVLGAFAPKATLNIIAGPRQADDLIWWRVGGISQPGGELVGWVAETAPNGVVLMQYPDKLPGTNIPDAASNSYLGAPFRDRYGISQLWGERPEVYSQFSYDGVPLQGHNGIDFLTPTGTELVAVENGLVAEVVYHDLSGFGHFVKVRHAWGESIYAHMQDIVVKPGQTVRRGDLLGHSDDTGYSGGPHLHFAIRINPYERTDGWGGYSDPLPYMDPSDFQLPPYVLPAPALRAAAAPATGDAGDAGAGMAPDHPDVTRP